MEVEQSSIGESSEESQTLGRTTDALRRMSLQRQQWSVRRCWTAWSTWTEAQTRLHQVAAEHEERQRRLTHLLTSLQTRSQPAELPANPSEHAHGSPLGPAASPRPPTPPTPPAPPQHCWPFGADATARAELAARGAPSPPLQPPGAEEGPGPLSASASRPIHSAGESPQAAAAGCALARALTPDASGGDCASAWKCEEEITPPLATHMLSRREGGPQQRGGDRPGSSPHAAADRIQERAEERREKRRQLQARRAPCASCLWLVTTQTP